MVDTEKITILLVYPCYVCAEEGSGRGIFNNGGKVVSHLSDVHDIALSSRPKNSRRPANETYAYVSDSKKPYDEKHFACPSCWHHTPELADLHTHIFSEHNIVFTERPSKKTETFQYDGSHYPKKAVQEIFNQINALTTKFQELLKM